jgi:dipeptidyl aminopeptidase/acylaminoacyl peptidase
LKQLLLRGVAAAALVAAACPVAAQSTHSLAEDAKAFGSRGLLEDADISPSGNKVLLLASAQGAATTATVIDIPTGKATRVAETTGRPEKLYWCGFAGEEHVVCQFGGVTQDDADLVSFSRLLTVRTDGTKMKPLAQQESGRAAYSAYSDGSIVDWMTGSEGRLLMARVYVPDGSNTGHLISRTKSGLGVDMIELDNLNSKSVEPARQVGSYLSDGRGNIRITTSWSWTGDGRLTGIGTTRFRKPGSRDWIDLGEYSAVTREGIYPLAVDAERNALFASQRLNGRDALVQIALDGSKTTSVIAKNDRVDIDGVVRFGRGQRVIGYTFADERRKVVYFDAEFDKLHDALSRALPNNPDIDFRESSRDGQKLLILASADTNPGAMYIFNRATKSLTEVGKVRPNLDNRTLATVKPIEVPAADGVKIPAYLTLPPGSSGKNLPAVVLPHGGPEARDEWGFDWIAQFLAARGYAVIQPNYRGSDGYGDAWLAKNGFQGWRTSIGDVTASAKHLVSEGIADPNRLAILGWSYGGYAALQSVATEPDLYKAAIAIAPVTDLAMLKTDSQYYTDRDIVNKFVGSGPHISEGSPLQNAQRIKVPVLLAHGDLDVNVNIRHSRAMQGALQRAGKPVEFLTFKGLDHQLDDSQARIAVLTKAGELLDRTIGH